MHLLRSGGRSRGRPRVAGRDVLASCLLTSPQLSVVKHKGLAKSQLDDLDGVITRTAEENAGMPVVYAVCQAVCDWLAVNNIEGGVRASVRSCVVSRCRCDGRMPHAAPQDGSMFAEMMLAMRKAEQTTQRAAEVEEQTSKEKGVRVHRTALRRSQLCVSCRVLR
jgi:hypothetical protein